MYQHRLKFEDVPLEIELEPDYIRDVPIKYSWVENNQEYSTLAHVDHPAFADVRDRLEASRYITTSRVSVNGDIVRKEFLFNGTRFKPGMKFFCAAAMRNKLCY